MKTITTNVYQYAELSDRAQENARDWFRTASEGDDFDSECVIDDAANIADLFGLDIRQSRKNLAGGGCRYEPSVSYSGFCSQGDGAAFTGSYKYKPGALAAVKSYAPQDTKLHAIVKGLQDTQKKHFYRLTASCKTSGYRDNNQSVEVDYSGDDARVIGEAVDDIKEYLSDFAHWIYCQLERDYDYQNADEQIIDSIEANEYDFTIEGELA